jgi:hypothetical protein
MHVDFPKWQMFVVKYEMTNIETIYMKIRAEAVTFCGKLTEVYEDMPFHFCFGCRV